MKKRYILSLLAGAVVSAQAAVINVNNGNFQAVTSNSPTDWNISGEVQDEIYSWNDGGAIAMAMKDLGGTVVGATADVRATQSLTGANGGNGGTVFASSYDDWTIDLDYGWRGNNGTDAEFTVSLYNQNGAVFLADNVFTLLASQATGMNNALHTQFTLSYDRTAQAAGDWIEIRIARTDGSDGLGGGNWANTAFVDNIAIDAAIPEPATLGMVAAFGGGLLFIRRKLMM